MMTDWLPEIVLTIVAVLCLVLAPFQVRRSWFYALSLVGMVAGVTLFYLQQGFLVSSKDMLAVFGRGLAFSVGLILVLTASSTGQEGEHEGERLGSLLLGIVGLALVARAEDLVLLFVGLELISVASYILLYVDKEGPNYREAATKYFYLSVLSSAVFLYGLSFVYGLAGTLSLKGLMQAGAQGVFAGVIGAIPVVLVLTGIGFKIAAVPFHFYAPDVYQGTSHRNAALLSALPKAAGMLVLVRLLLEGMFGGPDRAWQVVLALSVLTMTLGNVLALWQTHLRRLLAYSSIAHAGYMLIGLTVAMTYATPQGHPWDGAAALLFYLIVYLLATLGAFAVLGMLRLGDQPVETLDDLRGLAYAPHMDLRLLAWSLAIFMLSLAGIPPLAGFWGKLAVFFSALDVGGVPGGGPARSRLVFLAVVGAVNAAIAAGYYLRVVGAMFFVTARGETAGQERQAVQLRQGAMPAMLAVALCLIMTVLIGIAPGRWIDHARRASPTLRGPQRSMKLATMEGKLLEMSGPAALPLSPVSQDVSE